MSAGGSDFYLEPASHDNPALMTPEREGWTFSHWTNADGSAVIPTEISENNVLYAGWVDDINPELTISSTNNVAEAQTVTMTMDDKGSGISGYYFGTENPLTTDVPFVVSTDGSVNVSVGTDGHYYFASRDAADNLSVCEADFYTVTLDTEGGTLAVSKIVGLEGNTVELPTPEKTGYSFKGWELVQEEKQ